MDHRPLNKIIAECAKVGDTQAAQYWFGQMVMMGFAPNRNTYCSIILACVKAADLVQAESWILKLWKSGFAVPRHFCHLLVAPLLANYNDITDGVSKADFAANWLLRLNQLGVPLNRSSINSVLLVYSRAGDLERIKWWMSFMQQTKITPNGTTISALAMACKKADNCARAQKWYGAMEELGFKLKDFNNVNIQANSNVETEVDTQIRDKPLRKIISLYQPPR